jgi:hypothetical protein
VSEVVYVIWSETVHLDSVATEIVENKFYKSYNEVLDELHAISRELEVEVEEEESSFRYGDSEYYIDTLSEA